MTDAVQLSRMGMNSSDGADCATNVGCSPVLLWPKGAPGAIGCDDCDTPALYCYGTPVALATGAGIVICPGGGYSSLAMDHEGHQVAKWLNSMGVAAFVLKYRLAPYRYPIPYLDAQRAMRFVRSRAEELGVSSKRIGIMGFSAGGHLAATAAIHFDLGLPDHNDLVERVSSRPDFVVLCYPVVTMTEDFGHRGSKESLLGGDVDPALADFLSHEKQVTAETPPTFLFHTDEDASVSAENSVRLYLALRNAHVPAELHVYGSGHHGVGLAQANPALSSWKDRLADWLKANAFLCDVTRAPVRGSVTLAGSPLRRGMVTFTSADERYPLGWGIVSEGLFVIPASRGPVVGETRITVLNQGDVAPMPTLDDAESIRGPSFIVQSGDNECVVIL